MNILFLLGGITIFTIFPRFLEFDLFFVRNIDGVNFAAGSWRDTITIALSVIHDVITLQLVYFLIVHSVHYFKPSIRKSKKWIIHTFFNKGTFIGKLIYLIVFVAYICS